MDINSNNNLESNNTFNTSYIYIKFNFKLIPIHQTPNFIYFKGMGQYVQKNLNELINVNTFDVQIYGSSYKQLINKFINKNISINNNNSVCVCICDMNTDIKVSCYCSYIRHPSNLNNQIDIGLKIGQINNILNINI